MTEIEPVFFTTINPFLNNTGDLADHDLSHLSTATGTPADRVAEYAARLCYRSTARMGTAPGFIADLMGRGHEDVIEHGVATIRYRGGHALDELAWLAINRHLYVSPEGGWIYVTGNLRAWAHTLRSGCLVPTFADEIRGWLNTMSPQVFPLDTPAKTLEPGPWIRYPGQVWETVGQARITLLASNFNWFAAHGLGPECATVGFWDIHGSATILIEGVSRALTHQMVRSRLFSFSQESQRYVDLDKGAWQPVIPPEIAGDDEALAIMRWAFTEMETAYRKLRDLGIKKEDARFLLPNATETRLVATAPFAAWKTFLWQRALDKAAQWEIRYMSQAILRMLAGMAPNVFDQELAALAAMPEKDRGR